MDKNTHAIVGDLRTLIKVLDYKETKDLDQVHLTTRDYLAANADLIKRGLKAIEGLSVEEKIDLCGKHRLNESVIHGDGPEYGYHYVNSALEHRTLDPANQNRLLWYNASQLEPLERMMGYAKYLVDTSDAVLAMHPIIEHLPRKPRKSLSLTDAGDMLIGRVEVSGGLTQENQEAFEALQFNIPHGYPLIERGEMARVERYASEESPTEPFVTIIRIPKKSRGPVFESFRQAGYEIYE